MIAIKLICDGQTDKWTYRQTSGHTGNLLKTENTVTCDEQTDRQVDMQMGGPMKKKTD